MSCALVWFRRDLRLEDQPALQAASRRAERLAALYVLDDAESVGAPRGAASRWYLHYSLSALAGALARRNNTLYVAAGAAEVQVVHWARTLGADTVCFTDVREPAADAQADRVEDALREAGFGVVRATANLLTDPSEIRSGQGTPYRAFTPFWKRIRPTLHPARPEPAPEHLPPPPDAAPAGEAATVDALGLRPRLPWDEGLAEAWAPGEATARARLNAFVETRLARYETDRDWPSVDGTSCLSARLHFGELSIRTVWHAAQDHRSCSNGEAVDTFCSELGWREFAHHLLAQHPDLANDPMNPRFRAFPWADDPDGRMLARWQGGRTGIPLVDAGMRQLWTTGWMHNRVRMVVGSFLVKNLRLPWQTGEAFFRDTLVDWDLANNSMGWQWVSGCGADAAPYFRVFNPVRQGERFDPEGRYVRRWVPELAGLDAPAIHQPWAASTVQLDRAGVRLGHNYPSPIVDLKRSREQALAAFKTISGS